MFSNRIKYPFTTNEISKLLESKNKDQILNLVESNPTRVSIPYPLELVDSFRNEKNLIYEPNPRGLRIARRVIKKYYEEKGLNVCEDEIFITSGTSEAYSFIFKLLCNPYDNVLIPRPGYPLFEYLSTLECVGIKNYLLEYIPHTRWEINLKQLESQIDNKTRAIIVINPNNPTGSFISHEEKEELVSIAKKYDIAIISDEVFHDFRIEEKKFTSFANENRVLTFTLSGISKVLGLPQMKLAWIVINGPDFIKNEAIERLEVISDTFLSVSIPVQNALPKLFKYGRNVKEEILKRIKRNFEFLKNSFFNTSVDVLHTSGGWSAILRIPYILSEEDWVQKLLKEKNTLVYPGYFFDFESGVHIIISLIVETEKFKKGVENIKEIVYENIL